MVYQFVGSPFMIFTTFTGAIPSESENTLDYLVSISLCHCTAARYIVNLVAHEQPIS